MATRPLDSWSLAHAMWLPILAVIGALVLSGVVLLVAEEVRRELALRRFRAAHRRKALRF